MTADTRSPLTLSDRVVLFDYGEVISHSPSDAATTALRERSGAQADVFWDAYWRHRSGLDSGESSIADYWWQLASDTGCRWSDSDVHELWILDYTGWLSVNTATLDVIADLAAGGTRLAVLSNAGADFGSYLRHGSFGGYFERVFVSGELHMVKPHADIFEYAARELGARAEAIVFIDNKAENVEAAQALGMAGHVFDDAGGLRTYLQSIAD